MLPVAWVCVPPVSGSASGRAAGRVADSQSKNVWIICSGVIGGWIGAVPAVGVSGAATKGSLLRWSISLAAKLDLK